MPFLSIRNVHVSYGKNPVLREFNLVLEEGSISAIVGPSGCGKSTLLKSICGIVKPRSGTILLKGEPVNPKIHSLGYIPQHYGLLEWLTVRDNLSLGEKIKGTRSPQKDTIIEELGMKDWLDRYPSALSGGQQQRAALARAWIFQPDLLLMDEPFSSLDTFTAEKSRELFIQLWKKQKTTTLLVTHNLREAARMAKNIIVLSGQPARLLSIIDNPLFQKGVKPDETDFQDFEDYLEKHINQRWEGSI